MLQYKCIIKRISLICNKVANRLLKNSCLYRFSTLVMLILFTFSITPKLFLHDLFTNHTDTVYKKTVDDKAQVSKSGFTCDCNDLVATSPFTEHKNAIELPILFDYQVWV